MPDKDRSEPQRRNLADTGWFRTPRRHRSTPLRYAVALTLTLGSFAIAWLLFTHAGTGHFVVFVGAIALAAWYGGPGPSTLSIALAAILASYFFEPPLHSFTIVHPNQYAAIGVFALVGFMISRLTSSLQLATVVAESGLAEVATANERLEEQAIELEHQMEEARALAEDLEEARRKLEERSREQLAEAQSIAQLGSWEWNIASDSVEWSDELYRIYGFEPGAVRIDFETFFEHVHPDDRETMQKTIDAALAKHTPFSVDHRIVRADGATRMLNAKGRVMLDEAGVVTGMIGTGQDVTEQREMEAELRKAAEDRAHLEAAEKSGRRLGFLASASELLASSLDYEETLATVAKLAVPEVGDWSAVDLVAPGGSLQRLAVEHPDPEKLKLALELQRRWPPDPKSPVGAYEVIRSGKGQFMSRIPEEFLEKVARDPEHLEIIRSLGLRSFVIVPLVAGKQVLGAFTIVAAESGRSYDQSDLQLMLDLGRRAGVAIENARLHQEAIEAREHLEQQAAELEMQTEELQQQREEAEVAAEELRETTEQLMLRAAELDAARNEAEAARATADVANRAKSEFLATMSHELRTPLNAIGGYAQLLELGVRGELTDEQLADVRRIQRSQHHLLRLISEILNFAKIEAGRAEFSIKPIRLSDVLSDTAELIGPETRERRLQFKQRPAEDVFIMGDREKLQQVLLNLVSNAVKFTPPEGRIEVDCEVGTDSVRLSVRDTGIGIPPDKLEEVFQPFVQLGRGSAAPAEGTGLGLSISRELMHGMGGTLTATSRSGEGSVFTLTIPIARGKVEGNGGSMVPDDARSSDGR